ncbi:MAG: branched-chain amino acid ABC transporter permease [Streptosporangiaceae bacterium]
MTNIEQATAPSGAAQAAPRRWRGLRGPLAALVLALALAAWGAGIGSVASVSIMSLVLMYVALAQGWNLLGGYAGYVNFGTVTFFGIGAYTTAIASTDWHLPPLATVPLAAVTAGLAAVLIGVPALRLRGGYFAITTFVLTLAVQALALVLPITNGSTGIIVPGIGTSIATATRIFFLLFLALSVVATGLCLFVDRTRWRGALVAIREDEDAAEVLGLPTTALKSAALIVGSVIAGVAGSFYATQLFYIEPIGTFDFNISLAVVVAAVIGGSGTWFGPVIGAVVVELLAQELFIHVQGVYSELAYGALLVIVVLVAPRGLMGLAQGFPRKRVRA